MRTQVGAGFLVVLFLLAASGSLGNRSRRGR